MLCPPAKAIAQGLETEEAVRQHRQEHAQIRPQTPHGDLRPEEEVPPAVPRVGEGSPEEGANEGVVVHAAEVRSARQAQRRREEESEERRVAAELLDALARRGGHDRQQGARVLEEQQRAERECQRSEQRAQRLQPAEFCHRPPLLRRVYMDSLRPPVLWGCARRRP